MKTTWRRRRLRMILDWPRLSVALHRVEQRADLRGRQLGGDAHSRPEGTEGAAHAPASRIGSGPTSSVRAPSNIGTSLGPPSFHTHSSGGTFLAARSGSAPDVVVP